MLQQILKDMYIEPELLEALNEDQKKTLFIKMRQEQVRRWKEREEKEEEKEAHRAKAKAKPGQGKSVSWLLGRDGDVQVLVIGETDELKSSKLICTGLGERNTPTQLNTSRIQATTLKSNLINKASAEPVRSGRENHPPKTPTGIQLHLKDNSEEVKTALPPQAVASEAKPSTDSSPESQEDSQSARITATTAGGRPTSPPPALYRPHLRPVSVATTTLAHVSPTSTCASSLKAPDRSIGMASSTSSSSSSGGGRHSITSTNSGVGYGGSSSGGGVTSITSHGAVGYGGSSSSSSSGSSSSISSSISGVGGSRMTITPAGPSSSSSSSSSRTPAAQTQESQSSRGKEFRVMAASKRGASIDEIGVSSAAASAAASSPPPSLPTATAPSTPAPPAASGPVGRGRVAQLMKTFSVSSDAGPPGSSQAAAPFTRTGPGGGPAKPALPSKPSHLRLQQSASLR
ncbi:uncharacterized protein DDB_G0271670 [Engraulis encrasicolus]|uniref:uncharacterized protein DDB_G0271670 n=1 Tax=Engraulis encrasicolus TaxID=184585 RepID=UPI002FD1FF55